MPLLIRLFQGRREDAVGRSKQKIQPENRQECERRRQRPGRGAVMWQRWCSYPYGSTDKINVSPSTVAWTPAADRTGDF